MLFSGVAKIILSYVDNSREPDFSKAALFTVIHLYLGILCANISPCWPLFNKIARASKGSWVKMSELGKRWYGLNSWGPTGLSAGRGTVPHRSDRQEKTGAHKWQSEVEVGLPDFDSLIQSRSSDEPNMRQTQW